MQADGHAHKVFLVLDLEDRRKTAELDQSLRLELSLEEREVDGLDSEAAVCPASPAQQHRGGCQLLQEQRQSALVVLEGVEEEIEVVLSGGGGTLFQRGFKQWSVTTTQFLFSFQTWCTLRNISFSFLARPWRAVPNCSFSRSYFWLLSRPALPSLSLTRVYFRLLLPILAEKNSWVFSEQTSRKTLKASTRQLQTGKTSFFLSSAISRAAGMGAPSSLYSVKRRPPVHWLLWRLALTLEMLVLWRACWGVAPEHWLSWCLLECWRVGLQQLDWVCVRVLCLFLFSLLCSLWLTSKVSEEVQMVRSRSLATAPLLPTPLFSIYYSSYPITHIPARDATHCPGTASASDC